MNIQYQDVRKGFEIISCVLILVLLVSSCTDDIEVETSSNSSLMQKNLLESFTTDENLITRTDSIGDILYNSPDLTELDSIAEALDNLGSTEGWLSELIEIYGYPDWQMAISSDVTSSEKIIIIPFIIEEEVRGIIRCYDLSNGKFFKFYGHTYINGIPNNTFSISSLGEAMNFVSNYLYYEYRLRHEYNLELMEWLHSSSEDINGEDNTTHNREVHCVTTESSWWSCTGPESNPFLYCTTYTETIEDCYTIINLGGGGSWNGFPSGNLNPFDNTGAPPSGQNINTDDEEDIAENQKLMRQKNVRDCLRNLSTIGKAALSQAMSSLENIHGNKVCLDDLEIDIISGLIAEGLINCDSIEFDTGKIIDELTSAANYQASKFDQVLEDILNSDISDPCNTDLTSSDLAESALATMQTSGGCGANQLQSAFNEELSSITSIDFSGLKDICPKYYCLMKEMNTTNNSWLCGNVQELSSNEKFTYRFIISDDYEKIDTKASTDPINPSFNYITTRIPSSYCNGTSGLSDLELASRLIHESIHAKYLSWVFDAYKNGADIPDIAFAASFSIFTAIAEEKFHEEIESGNHHYLMFNYYKNIIMVALYELNNQEGVIGDYEYYAHVLMNTEQMAIDLTNPEKLAQFPWLATLGLNNFNLDNFDVKFGDLYSNLGYNEDCL